MNLAAPADPLSDREPYPAGNEGYPGCGEKFVGVDSVGAADLEDVPEAAGSEQANHRPRALEDRVRADGSPVKKILTGSNLFAGEEARDPSLHSLLECRRHRRHLADPDLT